LVSREAVVRLLPGECTGKVDGFSAQGHDADAIEQSGCGGGELRADPSCGATEFNGPDRVGAHVL